MVLRGLHLDLPAGNELPCPLGGFSALLVQQRTADGIFDGKGDILHGNGRARDQDSVRRHTGDHLPGWLNIHPDRAPFGQNFGGFLVCLFDHLFDIHTLLPP